MTHYIINLSKKIGIEIKVVTMNNEIYCYCFYVQGLLFQKPKIKDMRMSAILTGFPLFDLWFRFFANHLQTKSIFRLGLQVY